MIDSPSEVVTSAAGNEKQKIINKIDKITFKLRTTEIKTIIIIITTLSDLPFVVATSGAGKEKK